MWTVLLVEDEVFVRRMIRSSMQWEDKGFRVIGEAGNGMEAMEFIRRHRPHLVVTDIMMPLMNGVELLKQTRQEGYDCRFVMLSVMDDFNYVQQALEHGASNYMLKLYLSVEKWHAVLDKVDLELHKTSRSLSKDMHEVYDQMWKGIVEGWKTGDSAESRMPESFPWPSDKCGLIHVIHGKPSLSVEQFVGQGILEPEATPYLNTFTRGGQTTFFYWVPPSGSFKLKTPPRSDGIYVYAGATDNASLAEVWMRLMRRADELWYAGKTGVFGLGQGEEPMVRPAMSWEMEREIIRGLEQRSPDLCREHVGRIFELFRDTCYPAILVLEAVERLVKLAELMIGTPYTKPEEPLLTLSYDELRAWLERRLADSIRDWLERHTELTDHPEINKVIQYIREHYASEFTVLSLAEYAAMDDKYLSGLFKKKTGQTIVHYIQQVRIEHARLYMEHTDWPIAEIGSKVGFASENYFAKIFKRVVGTTPSLYRQSHRGKAE
ncbi:response regulator [Paenibacillus puerhi]|uniref:response regulator n=1 Tax=Paenibacillus puerhi TaxID=2692622 RepID=UPI0013594AC6|nr:response regulator [Paenibacillus puerhi]